MKPIWSLLITCSGVVPLGLLFFTSAAVATTRPVAISTEVAESIVGLGLYQHLETLVVADDTVPDQETTLENIQAIDTTAIETTEVDPPETKPDADTHDATGTSDEASEPVETNAPEDAADPELTGSEAELSEGDRQQLLIEADRLWRQGQFEQAEFLYRKAKNPFMAVAVPDRPAPISDPTLLPPGGQVYWREFQTGRELNLETRTLVPLELLVEQYPEFIPGHVQHAQVLSEQDRSEEALDDLERAATLYPDQPELIRARVTALAENEKWLEASIAARQFALLNPEHPTAAEFATLADENLDEHQDHLRRRLTGNAIANIFTGALGYALTGGLLGPISAIQTTALLLRGESDVGEGIAEQASQQLELVQDEAVVAYVNELGQKMADVAGRDEFEYEFYVVRDDQLNAFALPGGKVFVNAGAIIYTDSEAELSGLLAHELSHAVLSHGFQLVTSSSLTANLLQFVPYGGFATDLVVLSYSRDMERQADALGTQMLAASGYAADGLHNLMITLNEQDQPTPLFDWLSSHPDTEERIQNIEILIERNGYNRYAYEGVERHLEMQQRVTTLLGEPDPTEPDDEK